MCGSSPDLRPLLASHALDDVRGCSSDDETCSVVSDRSPLQSPLSPPSAGGDEADLLAFVSSTDQRASARKYSTAISKRSKPPSRPIAVQNTANVSTVPVKPLKWQLRLADRATAGVNLEAHYQIPPNVLFDLLADPMQHERIFDEIEVGLTDAAGTQDIACPTDQIGVCGITVQCCEQLSQLLGPHGCCNDCRCLVQTHPVYSSRFKQHHYASGLARKITGAKFDVDAC